MSELGQENDGAFVVLGSPKLNFPAVERKSVLDVPKITTHEQMRSFLTSQGVRFYPKERDISIQELDRNDIADVFGPKNLERAEETLGILNQYLYGEAVIDKWGNNHSARRIWRKAYEEEYGNLFREVYQKHNQARVNTMNIVTASLQGLSKCLRSGGGDERESKADSLWDIYADLRSKLSGSDKNTGEKVATAYEEMETDEEKLEVIRYFEDKIKESLDMIAPTDAKRFDMKVT